MDIFHGENASYKQHNTVYIQRNKDERVFIIIEVYIAFVRYTQENSENMKIVPINKAKDERTTNAVKVKKKLGKKILQKFKIYG